MFVVYFPTALIHISNLQYSCFPQLNKPPGLMAINQHRDRRRPPALTDTFLALLNQPKPCAGLLYRYGHPPGSLHPYRQHPSPPAPRSSTKLPRQPISTAFPRKVTATSRWEQPEEEPQCHRPL